MLFIKRKRNIDIKSFGEGLPIGKNKELIPWNTPIEQLLTTCEAHKTENNKIVFVSFYAREIFNGISLSFHFPFDTFQRESENLILDHVGSNLNSEDVEPLIAQISNALGEPDEANDAYGTYRSWVHDGVEIKIFPRYHHGSEWSAITIQKRL